MTPAEAEAACIALWQQWVETTVTPPPGQRYPRQLNPKTRQVEVYCR
jgi:hypothetical protein